MTPSSAAKPRSIQSSAACALLGALMPLIGNRATGARLEADVAVIGGGSAGFAAAWSAAHLGSAVVLVERESELGGTSTLGGVNNWEPGMGGTGVPYRVYQRLQRLPQAAGVAAHLACALNRPLRQIPAEDIRREMHAKIDNNPEDSE